MITIICEKLPRILKNKKRLESSLQVKITNRGKEVHISGESEEEYIAEKVIDALNFGFPFSVALLIKDEDFIFEIIPIKYHTTKKDFSRIKARVIGTQGKTLKTLTHLTNCFFEIKDNFVGIVGDPEDIRRAEESVKSLIKGTKQSHVYARLEKSHREPVWDLGLKDETHENL